MMGFRFRNEGALVVLQIYEPPKLGQYMADREGKWRDAKTEDLLDVARMISPERVKQEPVSIGFQRAFGDE